MGGVCSSGAADAVASVDGGMAVMPAPPQTKQKPKSRDEHEGKNEEKAKVLEVQRTPEDAKRITNGQPSPSEDQQQQQQQQPQQSQPQQQQPPQHPVQSANGAQPTPVSAPASQPCIPPSKITLTAAAAAEASAALSPTPVGTVSAAVPPPSQPVYHRNSQHYRSFSPSAVPIPDFHTKRRDHSGLEPGTLDEDGILAHTDFDIDLSRTNLDNDEYFAEFLQRRRVFEHHLNLLYERTPKRPRAKLPSGITYVRPFLSSTFKDFNEERNICFAQSFPRLEKLCNERNLFFAPLDLRWGVTSEQSGSGQVIKICMEEIDRSRPYFVCSLGFRNGWALMPSDNPADPYVRLLEKTFELAEAQFDWIAKCRDRSVTELEILHGALNDPDRSARCFFYFRSAAFLEALPKHLRKLFAEVGEAEKRLQQLKTRIVAAGFRVRYFNTPQQMSDYLEQDLKESIEQDFPVQKLTPLDREIKDHQAFGDMRTRVYVGGENYIEALDKFLLDESEGHAQVCVVSGASGVGKSSLIANWIKTVKQRARLNQFAGNKHNRPIDDTASSSISTAPTLNTHSHSPSLFHWNLGLFLDRYIGATSDSTQPGTLLRWILQEITERYEYIENPIPGDNKKVIEDFPEFLELASSNAPVLLVLDGLDQLYDEDDAHHLAWLPQLLPKTVKLIVSTVSGSLTHRTMMERACTSGAPTHTSLIISNVSDDQCLQLMRTFLNSYGKTLDGSQERRILACDRTRNPLYLITFLQEVRVFGSFENLTRRIDHYMDAQSVSEMFLKVIGRLEEDFDPSAPNLVRFTLSLMMLSRRGLNEVELKGALQRALNCSAQDSNFPSMEFSALMLRLDQQLVDQRGLRKFSHQYLKTAVEAKYFTPPPAGVSEAEKCRYMSQSSVRKILADYFCSIPVSDRRVEEAPWHLWTILHDTMEGGAWHDDDEEEDDEDETATRANTSSPNRKLDLRAIQRELQDQICNLDMFELLKGDYKYDLHKYWLLLESIKGVDVDDVSDGNSPNSSLTYTASCYSAVLKSWSQSDPKPSPIEFAEKAESIGTFLISTDRYVGADIFLDQALEIRSQVQGPEHAEVELLISKKANLFYRQGRYDEALPLYQRALEIVENLEGEESVRSSVLRTSIAGLLKEQGKFAESQPLYEKSLQDKIKLLGPKHPVVAVSMSNLAELHLRLHQPDKALPLYQDSLQIMESERGRSHPEVATIVSSLASCYMQLAHYQDAIKLYERARKIKEDLLGSNHVSVAIVLNNLAATYQKQGDASKALKLLERSLKIRQAVHGKDSPLIVQTLQNMGDVYLEEKKHRAAQTCFSHALDIMEREKGKLHVDLMGTLTSQAKLHYDREEYAAAINIYKRQLEIMETNYGADDERVLQPLNNLGMAHQTLHEYSAALPFHLRVLRITRLKYGEHDAHVADVLMNLGVLFVSLEKVDVALDVVKRCFVIRRDVLGMDAAETQEALEWIQDLADDEDEVTPDKMEDIKLDDIPIPDEINEEAQEVASKETTGMGSSEYDNAGLSSLPRFAQRLPSLHAPSKSVNFLPPIGLPGRLNPVSAFSSLSPLPSINSNRSTLTGPLNLASLGLPVQGRALSAANTPEPRATLAQLALSASPSLASNPVAASASASLSTSSSPAGAAAAASQTAATILSPTSPERRRGPSIVFT